MRLRDFVTIHSASVNPQNEPKKHYHLYSLPSFDNNQTREEVTGSEIQSNKNTVPDRCILFNKLNVRFKRIWLIDNGDEDKICSTEFLPLVIDESKVDFYYCYFLLQSPAITDYLTGQNTNTSGSHKRIDPTDFLDIQVNIPSLGQQKKAGSILYSIERKIMLNRQINDNLEAMAKQLYDYWFVQFDFPGSNGLPFKSNGGSMVWNALANRWIPQGWQAVTLKNKCKTYLGGTPNTEKAQYWGGEYPWLNSGEVAEFPIVYAEKTITQEGLQNSATSLLREGCVTLSITRHLRPSILAFDACINQSVVGIAENDGFRKSYIYPLIARDIPRLMALRTGAQQPHISKDVVDNIPFVVPPVNILENYYALADAVYDSIISTAKQSFKLIRLRNSLLPLLMNGQVRVN